MEILNRYLFMNLNLGNSPFLIHRDAVRIQSKGEMLESLRQESQIHTWYWTGPQVLSMITLKTTKLYEGNSMQNREKRKNRKEGRKAGRKGTGSAINNILIVLSFICIPLLEMGLPFGWKIGSRISTVHPLSFHFPDLAGLWLQWTFLMVLFRLLLMPLRDKTAPLYKKYISNHLFNKALKSAYYKIDTRGPWIHLPNRYK